MGCEASNETQAAPDKNQQRRKNKKNVSYKKNGTGGGNEEMNQKFVILSQQLKAQQVDFAIEKLQSHQLFGSLTLKQLRAICEQMISVKMELGEYVFKQGDIGNSFFIVESGEVDVEIDQKVVRSLNKGQTFGQLALLFKCSRTASIVCKKQCKFFVIKPDLYKQTLKKMKLQEYSTNAETINKVPLFACLTNKQKFALSNTIKIVIFNKNDVIFQAGDDAQAIYIISQGSVKIQINGKKDIFLNAGQIFGESSIHANSKRSGTAVAHTKVICSLMSRKDIQNTLGSSINNLIYFNIKKWALMRSDTFKNLNPQELNTIITEFQLFEVKDNEKIDEETHKGFVICLEGNINNQAEGIVFNEEGWKNKTFKCEKLKKNQNGFCCFLAYKKAEKIFQEIKNKKKLTKYQQKKIENSKNKFNFSDFSVIKKLGQGQFGQVFLVRNVQFGTNLYAIKCLKKEYIKKEEIIQSVVQQRQILQKTIFPYIVGYVKAFQDKNYIFLLMEYIHGKQMFDVIRQVKMMTPDMVKYYFGCIMISIEYLHSNGIVYRDIKPENSVVDSNGKVFLIDLGTAKELSADKFFKTFTIIGTPHYMAPEIFQGNGYSFQVDLWSLGCLLYQFFCFGLPFGQSISKDPYAVYTSIKKDSLAFPKFMKDEKAKKLIGCLLSKSPKQRGMTTFKTIKSHDFYKGFNWNDLLQQSMKSPYIPKDFRNSPLSELNYIQGKQLLKYMYNSDKDLEIQEWTSDKI